MGKFCVACGTSIDDAPRLYAKEMMLGTQESFGYLECSSCGTLQIEQLPSDVSPYYTQNYYSTSRLNEGLFKPWWKAYAKGERDRYCLTGRGLLGQIIQNLMPNQATELINFRHLRLHRHMRILDVGCGVGKLPYIFWNAGFTGILGIEPFIEKEIAYNSGLLIKKGFLGELDAGRFDLIMFNHSFEHLPDPHEQLEAVKKMLAANGRLLIRIPTVSSFAYSHYRENWVQLDAPRHTVLYSIQGIQDLAAFHGFKMEKLLYEGSSFQFIGSEQYCLGIPMYGDSRSWFEGNKQLFADSQLQEFELRARQLNESGEGDSIAVTFVKD